MFSFCSQLLLPSVGKSVRCAREIDGRPVSDDSIPLRSLRSDRTEDATAVIAGRRYGARAVTALTVRAQFGIQ